MATWLVTRLCLLVFTFMTSLLEAAHSSPVAVPYPAVTQFPYQMLFQWRPFDAHFYQDVALHGYRAVIAPFFLLYPLLSCFGLLFTTPATV